MSEENTGWKVSNNPLPIPSNIQKQLDDLNRQYQNRSCWRKLKDWCLYPKGHRQIAMNETSLAFDQLLLLKIHQKQIDEAATTYQLLMVTLLLVMVTLLLVVIGFITLIKNK